MNRSSLFARLLPLVDPRLQRQFEEDVLTERSRGGLVLAPGRQLVLVGHRAAGKSRMLACVAEALGLPAFELDEVLQKQGQRGLAQWITSDQPGFRAAERETFLSLPVRSVVAAGGGFLSLHADLLAGRTGVLIPVSFRTMRERLLADTTRPRLRPELSVEEELRAVYRSRELLHRAAPVLPLARFVAAVELAAGVAPFCEEVHRPSVEERG